MKFSKTFLCIIFFGLLLIPTISFFAADSDFAENIPSLINDDNRINTDFSDECEEYFSDNLPIKDTVITINNFIKSNIFKSETSNVINGSDDYLFYSETVDDYLKTDVMNDREVYTVSKTISLLSEYCEDNNVEFVFTAVPNKNTILSDKMPYNFISTDNKSNLQLIEEELQKQSICYVDLSDCLNDEDLYLKNDSHWNNKGAYLGFIQIMQTFDESVGLANIQKLISENPFYAADDWSGDLAAMLFPSTETYNTQYYTDAFEDIAENINIRIRGSTTADSLELMETIIKNPDENYSEIFTSSNYDYASGSLFMLRDSFARAMFPYFASFYEKCDFVKSFSYDAYVYPIEDYSNFIFEIVERSLTDILETQQKIPAPKRENISIESDISNDASNGSTFNCSDEYSDYLYIDGTIDSELLDADSDIYVVINDSSGSSIVYEAFPGEYDETTDSYRYYMTVNDLESGSYTAYVTVENTAVASGEINI